ncbi:ATPase, T2SS/T4P/T4SS family [Polynucleobacter sp. Fuers-14]|uniref:ATPase, T2SS/T4P/T4SS family n=1 Tax=Polynucleobacter sp. Fuers-14 TaxID=1758364 RepID=UPI001C0C0752|nr:ATPase, T2SS/T4P/T4SS family [Polynucleobacter sp. Fuers-14]MBU3640987.1 Flp pilus assembly complex ATPase component TadA [Polynucleobacter sp. Fuers-14]
MPKTLLDLVFSDIYLLENPRDCRYKESSDSLRLREFEAPLHEELSKLYRYLGEQCDASTPGSMTALWPAATQSAMRLRVTNLVGSNDQTVFYIRRYRQGVATLADLGVPKPIIERLLSPTLTQGLCMLGGKAGSGKTTLANSMIVARLTALGGVCVTAENPVELQIAGRHGDGMCFSHEVNSDQEMATAVINFLRTSPNIIFLGEIRDAFVAKEAVLAALSGHLVITTFHGPSLVGALARFAGFIGDNNLLADALSAVAYLELCETKDQTELFSLKSASALSDRRGEGQGQNAPASIRNSKKLTIDFLWFLGPEGTALSSVVRSGNFPMLSSEISRQRNHMLQSRS